MKVQVGVDEVSYKIKPDDKYKIVACKERAISNWLEEVDIKELADCIGNQGHAFVPAHLVGGMKAENCKGMQLFGLDFDDGISFNEIQRRCEQLQLPIAFAYHTFNSSPELEKFRVVFASEIFIEDIFVVGAIINMLHKIFPECDPLCKNLDRVFMGGKDLIYCKENAAVALVQIFSAFNYTLEQKGNYLRELNNFCKKYQILMINNRAAMGDENVLSTIDENDFFMDSAIIHIIAQTTNKSFFVIENKGLHQRNSRKVNTKLKRVDIGERSTCQLLNDFLNGEDLGHDEKFAIATNLIQINGGRKVFLDTIEKTYSIGAMEKWEKDISYMCCYRPMRCSNSFCHYYENCNQLGTIVDTLSVDRKVYREKEKYYPMDEAVELLKDNLEQAYRCQGQGVHLIKAQTAIGKTTQYIDLITRHPESKFLIALPTNILKKQVMNDLIRAGIGEKDLYMTPSLSDSIYFREENEIVMDAHRSGVHNKKKKVLKETYEKIKDNPQKQAMADECLELINGVDEITEQRVVVTTHAFFMYMKAELLSRYTIIVDEDILLLHAFAQVNTISESCLQKLVEQAVPGYSQIASTFLAQPSNLYKKVRARYKLLPLNENELSGLNVGAGDNINDMQYAEAFVKVKSQYSDEHLIQYFCPPQFSAQKYIVLSATLNETIYKEFFKGKLPVYTYETKKVAYTGKVIQYTYHSLGRRDLSGKMEVFSYAREIAKKPNLEIITFKEGPSIKGVDKMNTKNLHFGNTIGMNCLSGQDIGIVGTPYMIESAYKLIACYLGANVNNKNDKNPRPRRVNYKGASFIITTYEEPLLQEFQLYALESELEQCVGRARVLRKKCTAYVFSAFPCEQAEIHMSDYL